LTKAGEYEFGEIGDTQLEISCEDMQKLIIALDEEGFL